MRRPLAHATLAAAAALAVSVVLGRHARPAAAADLLEPPRPRQGYYFALGYSFALNKNWEDDKAWGFWPGTELKIRMGQMITRRFGLGLQIHTGGAEGQGQASAFGGLTMEGQFEIARNLALYGGIGVDVVSLTSKHMEDKTTRGAVGSGYYLGASYDWFFTKRAHRRLGAHADDRGARGPGHHRHRLHRRRGRADRLLDRPAAKPARAPARRSVQTLGEERGLGPRSYTEARWCSRHRERVRLSCPRSVLVSPVGAVFSSRAPSWSRAVSQAGQAA